jgi:hypothetical protein
LAQGFLTCGGKARRAHKRRRAAHILKGCHQISHGEGSFSGKDLPPKNALAYQRLAEFRAQRARGPFFFTKFKEFSPYSQKLTLQ